MRTEYNTTTFSGQVLQNFPEKPPRGLLEAGSIPVVGSSNSSIGAFPMREQTNGNSAAACSLIGNAPILLLVGMDPASRRFFWEVLQNLTREGLFVLSSHSMEECEACTRIAIMVNGEF